MANLTANTPKTARARAQKLLVRYAEVGMELDLLKNERKLLEEEYANLRRALQDYADDATNAADFNDKQMLRLDSGSFGYRAGTEKLTWDLDRAEAEPLRTQQVCAVLKKLLPTAIKTSYDEKAIVKVWAHMPKLQEQLGEYGITGVVREPQFIVTVAKA